MNNKLKQKVKAVVDKTTKRKSKRVQKRQPAKVVKQTTMQSGIKRMLAAGKGKSTTTSQRLRHLDQVIDNVASGCVCADEQNNPDGTSLVAGPVTTSVNTCPVQGSDSAHNGGNVMALQDCVANAEAHAAENDRVLQNGRTINTTRVSHQDGTNVKLQQRPILDERDLSNALRSVFGSLSNVSGQNQVSVGMAPQNSDGPVQGMLYLLVPIFLQVHLVLQ